MIHGALEIAIQFCFQNKEEGIFIYIAVWVIPLFSKIMVKIPKTPKIPKVLMECPTLLMKMEICGVGCLAEKVQMEVMSIQDSIYQKMEQEELL